MLVNCKRNYYVNLEKILFINQNIHIESMDTCLPVRVVFFKLVSKCCMNMFLVPLLMVRRENNIVSVLRTVMQKRTDIAGVQ